MQFIHSAPVLVLFSNSIIFSFSFYYVCPFSLRVMHFIIAKVFLKSFYDFQPWIQKREVQCVHYKETKLYSTYVDRDVQRKYTLFCEIHNKMFQKGVGRKTVPPPSVRLCIWRIVNSAHYELCFCPIHFNPSPAIRMHVGEQLILARDLSVQSFLLAGYFVLYNQQRRGKNTTFPEPLYLVHYTSLVSLC